MSSIPVKGTFVPPAIDGRGRHRSTGCTLTIDHNLTFQWEPVCNLAELDGVLTGRQRVSGNDQFDLAAGRGRSVARAAANWELEAVPALYIRHKTGPVRGREHSHARRVMATMGQVATSGSYLT
ncbi:MAG: hypothetical protein AUK55_07470 [Syntrophobacteraceae bacterium CG2_30_61_12]|nr:MAG: hypothetical protein AUK55_07470 [Syntrophobacteraceae bacterium CG2_30_61_12]